MESMSLQALNATLSDLPGSDGSLYCLIDGGKRNHPLSFIYSHDNNPHWARLYDKTPFSQMPDLSPVVVKTEPHSRLVEAAVNELVPRGAAVFLKAAQDLEGVAAHCRWLLEVSTEDGRRLLFRYYEPLILEAITGELAPEKLASFMGPISALVWLSPHSLQWRYQQHPHEPSSEQAQDYATHPWIMPQAGVGAVLDRQARPSRLGMSVYVKDHTLAPAEWDMAQCLAFVDRQMECAGERRLPIQTRAEAFLYLEVALEARPEVLDPPGSPELTPILRNPDLDTLGKLERIQQRL